MEDKLILILMISWSQVLNKSIMSHMTDKRNKWHIAVAVFCLNCHEIHFSLERLKRTWIVLTDELAYNFESNFLTT